MGLTKEAKALVASINGAMGKDTVVLGSDMAVKQRFTTGSLSLDVALGGGWPADQWVEVYGRESAGKTAMVLKTIAANQAIDPKYSTFWVAAERYDEQQATALGVDNSRVIVAPAAQEAELAFDLLLHTVESKAATAIVLDSYPALLPDEEAAKSMGESTVALGARLMNKFCRKAGKASHRDVRGNDPSFHGIIINQQRDKIGWSPGSDPLQTTPGGNGKNYFFYARVEVKRKNYITEKRPGLGNVPVGQTIQFHTIKNKSASPRQEAKVDFYFRGAPFLGYKRGDYDLGSEYVEVGWDLGVITGSPNSPVYRDQSFRGRKGIKDLVREDVGFKNLLRQDVLEVANALGADS
jgi:recombination protein RecA